MTIDSTKSVGLSFIEKGYSALRSGLLESDAEERLKWLISAWNQGWPVPSAKISEAVEAVILELDWKFYELPSHSLCANLLQVGADAGSLICKEYLAHYYVRGFIKGKTRLDGTKLFVELSEKGLSTASHFVAALLEGAYEHPRDDDLAFYFFQKYLHQTDLALENDAQRADSIFNDEGYGFVSTEELWRAANITHLKAVGYHDPYSYRIKRQDILKLNLSNSPNCNSLVFVAVSLLLGRGIRQDVCLARVLLQQISNDYPDALTWIIEDPFLDLHGDDEQTKKCLQSFRNIVLNSNAPGLYLAFIEFETHQEWSSFLLELSQHEIIEHAFFMAGMLLAGRLKDIEDIKPEYSSAHDHSEDKVIVEIMRSQERLRGLLAFRLEFEKKILVNANKANDEKSFSYPRLINDSHPNDLALLCELMIGIGRENNEGLQDFLSAWKYFSENIPGRLKSIVSNLTRRLAAADETSCALFEVNQPKTTMAQKVRDTFSDLPANHIASVARATSNIGYDYNERSKEGLPRWTRFQPGVAIRAKDKRSFPDKALNSGWDEAQEVSVGREKITVLNGKKAPNGYLPFILLEDLEVLGILTLIEPHENGVDVAAPSFSLERFEPKSGYKTKLLRKEFYNPSWLRATNLGKSMYYADTLLFIKRYGDGIFSSYDPFFTPVQSSGWQTPLPWLRADMSGGVGSNGRNAFMIAHRLEGASKDSQFDAKRLRLNIPSSDALPHFDGSERIMDAKGNEIHRDGYRGWLRSYYVRHADVLTRDFNSVRRAFPVFERVRLLLGLYSDLRLAFDGRRNEFRDTPLWSRLEHKRQSYIKEAKNMERWDQYVLP